MRLLRHFAWIFLLPVGLFSETDSHLLIDTQGVPSSLVDGCVSVISGNFVHQHQDFEIMSAEPIQFERSYSSGDRYNRLICFQWATNHPEEMFVHRPRGKQEIYGGENGGSALVYHWIDGALVADPKECHERGLTNSHAYLGGQTNYKNRRAELARNWTKVKVETGGQEKRWYQRWTHDKKYGVSRLLVHKVQKPNGNWVHYLYKGCWLSGIQTFARDEKTLLSEVCVVRKGSTMKVFSGEELLATYTSKGPKGGDPAAPVIKMKTGRGGWKKRRVKFPRKNLKSVETKKDGLFEIEMIRVHMSLPEKVRRIVHEGVPIVEVEYYSKGSWTNPIYGRVKEIRRPVGPNGELVATHTFSYTVEKGKGGSCLVKERDGGETTYHWDAESHLIKVERLDSIEEMEWGDKESCDATNLLRRRVSNREGELLWEKRYIYDQSGNVVKEELEGNIGGEVRTVYREAKFDAFNRVIWEIDTEGVVTEYEYLEETTLVTSRFKSEDSFIFEREFTEYSLSGVPIRQTRDEGRVMSRQADELNGVTARQEVRKRLLSTGLPVSQEVFSYDLQAARWVLLSEEEYRYDAQGRLIEQVQMGKAVHEWEYDDRGRLVLEKDPLGHEKRHVYDAWGNQVEEHGPVPGVSKRFEYDAAGRCVAEHLSDQTQTLTTRFKYDHRSLKVEELTPAQELIRYRYDALGRLVGKEYVGIGEEKTAYDPQGYIREHTTRGGHTTVYKRTFDGRPLEIYYPDGSVEKFRYSSEGHVLWKGLREGAEEFFSHDSYGHTMCKTVFADGVLLNSEQWVYEGTRLVESVNPLRGKTVYTHDVHGRVIQERCAAKEKRFGYDLFGHTCLVVQGEKVIHREHDLLGRVVLEQIEGGKKSEYSYDANGEEIAKVSYARDGSCLETNKRYDLLGRLIEVDDAQGEVARAIYEVSGGRRKRIVAPNGVQTVEHLDALERCVKREIFGVKGNLLSSERHEYDPDGNCVLSEYQSLPLGESYTVRQVWGAMHHLEQIQEEERVTRQSFNRQGLMNCVERPDGSFLNYKYDGLGRLVSLISSRGDVRYLYTYDEAGNLTQVLDQVNRLKTERVYNVHSELVEEIQASGLWIRYHYNQFGKKTSCTLPDGSKIEYGYRGGELVSVRRGDKEHIYERDEAGRIITQELMAHNGKLEQQRDAVGRLIGQEHHSFCEQNSFDSVGNLLSSNDFWFRYNELSQLVEERSLEHHTHEHSSLHCRIAEDGHQAHHSKNLELQSFKSTELSFNANGEPVQIGELKLCYDSLGRLTSAVDSLSEVSYVYDHFNRVQIELDAGGGLSTYLYDGQDEVARYVGDEVVEAQILGEGGQAVLIEKLGGQFVPLYDVRGNIAHLLNEGVIVGSQAYSAYGKSRATKESTPWGFKGKRHMAFGMVNFGHRFYLPKLGIWLTPDPSGYQDGPNRYAYVHGNPSSHTDQYGLTDIDNSFTSHVGIGQYSKTDRFIFLNGMLNQPSDAKANATAISNQLDGARVYYTYSPTRGIASDLWGCARWNVRQVMAGRLSQWLDPHREEVDELKYQLRQHIGEMSEDGMVHLFCHSRGSQVVKQAISEMDYEERAQLAVASFGAAALFDQPGVAQIDHYISSRDPIPFLSQSVWWQMVQGQNIHMKRSPLFEGVPYDHKFLGRSYQESLRGHMDQLKEQRGWK